MSKLEETGIGAMIFSTGQVLLLSDTASACRAISREVGHDVIVRHGQVFTTSGELVGALLPMEQALQIKSAA